jgi:phosphoribosylglycinamide formyltransferase-1
VSRLIQDRLKIAVGISGGGRSLRNLLVEQAKHQYEVVLVFSSSQSCLGNDIARTAGVPVFIDDFRFKNQSIVKKRLYDALRVHGVDMVVLAGFLKLLPIDVNWPGKIINIHPALLPKFGGKGMHGRAVHEAVLAAGEVVSGATVHFVNEQYDEGAIISQIEVTIEKTDTVDALASRVFAAECRLLPWTIDRIAEGVLPAKHVVRYCET